MSRSMTTKNSMCLCSAETQDSSGRWVPCAVQCLPYDEPYVIERVDRQLAVMKAMTGSMHAPTLLCDGTTLVNGDRHHCMAARSVSES